MTPNTLIKSNSKTIQIIGIVGGQEKNIEFGLMTLLNSSIHVKFQDDHVHLLENTQNSILSYLRGQLAQRLICEEKFFEICSRISYSPYLEDLKNCDLVFEDSPLPEEREEKILRLENIIGSEAILLSKTDAKQMQRFSHIVQKKSQFFGIKYSEKEGHDSLIQIFKTPEASQLNANTLKVFFSNSKLSKFSILDLPSLDCFKIILAQVMEGISQIEYNKCSYQEFDILMKNCQNARIGPFEFVKRIGLDFFFDSFCAEEESDCCGSCQTEKVKFYLKDLFAGKI